MKSLCKIIFFVYCLAIIVLSSELMADSIKYNNKKYNYKFEINQSINPELYINKIAKSKEFIIVIAIPDHYQQKNIDTMYSNIKSLDILIKNNFIVENIEYIAYTTLEYDNYKLFVYTK